MTPAMQDCLRRMATGPIRATDTIVGPIRHLTRRGFVRLDGRGPAARWSLTDVGRTAAQALASIGR